MERFRNRHRGDHVAQSVLDEGENYEFPPNPQAVVPISKGRMGAMTTDQRQPYGKLNHE
jgi:hypothetical protein